MKLTCMRGYSGSGKSMKAAEIAKETNSVIVCRDELRKMLLGSYWTGIKTDEDRVTVAEEAQVTAFLAAQVDLVIDATHLHAAYLRRWARLATRMGAEFEVVNVVESLDVCKRRDHARMLAGGRYVGDRVIEQQFQNYPMYRWPTVTAEPFTVEPVERQRGLPEAIICDIDGTVAHIVDRSPYDYSRVSEDELDDIVFSILDDYKSATSNRGQILMVSGRDHTCREETVDWLDQHGIPYDRLWMRDANLKNDRGGKIPDYIVKYGIFNERIRGKYNILYVLDDRTQVVEMWRKLGLKCLQVAPGDF